MTAMGKFGALATRLEAVADEVGATCLNIHLMLSALESSVNNPENSEFADELKTEIARLEEAAKLASKASVAARAAANRMHTTVGTLLALGA